MAKHHAVALAFLALAPLCGTASAQSVNWPLSTVRNVTTLGGTVVRPADVQRYAFAVATGGLVVDAATSLPVNGQLVPVAVRAPISNAAAAGALGRFVRRVAPPIAMASAFYDLALDLGFTLTDSEGALVVQRVQASSCSVAPCYEIKYDDGGGRFSNWVPASQAATACRQFADAYGRTNPQMQGGVAVPYGYILNALPPSWAAPQCGVLNSSGRQVYQALPTTRTTAPVPSSLVEVPLQDLEDAIAQQSGWPAGSNIAPALRDAVAAGETVATQSPTTLTGPATTPGREIVSQSGDQTTTTTTTNNHTYNNNTVTTSIVTVTTVTNTATGEPISQTTSTETPVLPAPPADPPDPPCGIPGKPPCDVKIDETGTPEDGSKRLDDDKTGFGQIRPAFDAAMDQAEQIQAPPWSWTFALPTACSPLPMGAFSFEIDVCDFQPVIHDLMSLVWIAAGIFGLLGLLRNALGGAH